MRRLGELGGGAADNVAGVGILPDNHIHGVQLDEGVGSIDVMGCKSATNCELVEQL